MFKRVYYQIDTEKIRSHIKIAHLSDLHGASYGEENRLLVEALLSEQPDIVVMTGDMADEKEPSLEHFLALSRQISRLFTTYYIPGNHEQRFSSQKLKALFDSLFKNHVTVLDNESQLVSLHGSPLRIYGLITPMMYYKDLLRNYNPKANLTAADTAGLLGNCDRSVFTLLLSHNPLYFPAYRSWGADLTLSGHIHGGIVRLPKLGGLLSPEAKFFPKYDGGHFCDNQKHLIVSRGLGNNFGVRINNPPELVFITISGAKCS